MIKIDKKYYTNSEVIILMAIEQKLLEILEKEYYKEEINTSHIASICMGLLETYKEMNSKKEIEINDFKDLELFINNNKIDITQSLFNLLDRFKETDELEKNKFKYC